MSSDGSVSIIECEVCGCYEEMASITSCCHVPVCETDSEMYQMCSRKSCNLYYEEICFICIEINSYQCKTCKITFCDDCCSDDLLKSQGCKYR